MKALAAAARDGTSFGAPSPLEVELGERVRALMPSIERVRFVSSGTEATMSAVRVARAATGRDEIVKFEGCYHGHADAFLVKAGSGALTLGAPTSPGVTRAAVGRHAGRELQRSRRRSSALFDANRERDRRASSSSRSPATWASCRRPTASCARCATCARPHGALLIFDEVISGFRAAPGGAQAVSGVRPDLTCLGKIIGGGLPVGAYGGRADLMELVSPAGPVYQAGTLSGNPLAMTAGLWCLDRLTPRLYASLAALGTRLAAGLADAARDAGVALQVNAFGSLLTPFFTDRPVRDYASATSADTESLRRVLPRHAGARRLPAAVAVRSVVPVGGAHARRTSTRRSPRRGQRCGTSKQVRTRRAEDAERAPSGARPSQPDLVPYLPLIYRPQR